MACRRCPKFDEGRAECGVPFGSPLRKCVVAATEEPEQLAETTTANFFKLFKKAQGPTA